MGLRISIRPWIKGWTRQSSEVSSSPTFLWFHQSRAGHGKRTLRKFGIGMEKTMVFWRTSLYCREFGIQQSFEHSLAAGFLHVVVKPRYVILNTFWGWLLYCFVFSDIVTAGIWGVDHAPCLFAFLVLEHWAVVNGQGILQMILPSEHGEWDTDISFFINSTVFLCMQFFCFIQIMCSGSENNQGCRLWAVLHYFL